MTDAQRVYRTLVEALRVFRDAPEGEQRRRAVKQLRQAVEQAARYSN